MQSFCIKDGKLGTTEPFSSVRFIQWRLWLFFTFCKVRSCCSQQTESPLHPRCRTRTSVCSLQSRIPFSEVKTSLHFLQHFLLVKGYSCSILFPFPYFPQSCISWATSLAPGLMPRRRTNKPTGLAATFFVHPYVQLVSSPSEQGQTQPWWSKSSKQRPALGCHSVLGHTSHTLLERCFPDSHRRSVS